MLKDYLYIFLHIPKTGGSTFSQHIKENLKKDEFLDMSNLRYGFEKRDISQDKLKTVKVVLGHASYYGIHKMFPEKIPRYVVFLRDPAERVVSSYNFEMRVKDGKNLSFWRWYSAQPKNEIVNFLNMKYLGKEGTKANVPDIFLKMFYKIFKSKKITLLFQSIFKEYYKLFLSSDESMKIHLENSKKLLDNCYKIGIISDLDRDLSDLFKIIGVPAKWKNTNVTEKSKTFFRLDEKSRKKIYGDNKYDLELFDYAVLRKKMRDKK